MTQRQVKWAAGADRAEPKQCP